MSNRPDHTDPGRIEELQRQVADAEARAAGLSEYVSRLESLQVIDRSIRSGLTVEETADVAATQLLAAINCQRVAIVSYPEDEPDMLVFLATKGAGEELTPAGTRLPRAAEELHVEDHESFRLHKISQPDDRLLKRLRRLGLRSYAAFPMLQDGVEVGAVTIWTEVDEGISERDAKVVRGAADRFALALSRARLLELVQQQNVELEERNEDLRAVTYSTTHDLQAPLRAMRGFGEALLQDYGDSLDEVAHDFIRRIVESAAHMDDLIRGMLVYSQVVRMEPELTRVSLQDVVKQALEYLDPAALTPRAIIRVGKKDAEVLAHAQTLTQIVANLVSNALKFARPGVQPRISITVAATKHSARLSVKDNGVGVAVEYRDRIFGLFERLYTDERYPGTGIGLAIVRKGIERMGGTVGVKSSLGEGSTFWIQLPIA